MRCPTLSQLPPPSPRVKDSWPWKEETRQLPDVMPDGYCWPKVSIVTPSYNQGEFIEETIRSILLQGYPNLEYIIIDGGSSDGSLDIIKKYKQWLAYWVSEPDRGQAHAINKGFTIATSSLIGWINSDDLLLPGSLHLFAVAHRKHPDSILTGDVDHGTATEKGWSTKHISRSKGLEFRNSVEFWNERMTCTQPGTLFPTALLHQVGFLDETLRFAFDYDLMCRVLMNAPVQYLGTTVARFRLHAKSKTVSEGHLFWPEAVQVSKRYWNLLPQVDISAYNRNVPDIFFRSGLLRCLKGNRDGVRLIWQAMRMNGLWILSSIPRRIIFRVMRK